jgi:hypothetical protein
MLRIPLIIIFAALTVMVSGCARSTVGLKPQDVAELKTVSEIPAVHGQPPTFRVVGRGSMLAPAMFGIVGGLVAESMARSEGKDLVKEYGLGDPAGRIKERLAAALAERLALDNVRTVSAPVEDIDVKTLRSAFKEPVVLAVQTDQWSLTSVDLSSHYGVTYAATARIVKTTDGTVLSKANCRLGGKEFAKLTMNELRADNAAQLKTRLGQTADLCVQRLIGELLSRETVNAAASTK